MKNKTEDKKLEEAIIDLYLAMKSRKIKDNENLSIEQEKKKLMTTDPRLILDYIKSSLDILIDLKVQEKYQADHIRMKEEVTTSVSTEYEKELRHLESEIRNHIKYEYQLKLQNDTLKGKIEELEKSLSEGNKKILSLQEQLNKYKDTKLDSINSELLENLKSENSNLKQLIKSYEDRNVTMKEIERKYMEKQSKFDKDLIELEVKYKEKIKYLTRKLNKLENSKFSKEHSTEIVNDNSPYLTDRTRNNSAIIQKKIEDNKEKTQIEKGGCDKKNISHFRNIMEDFKLRRGEITERVKETILDDKKDLLCGENKNQVRTDSLSKINENVKSMLSKKIANNHTRNNSYIESKHLTCIHNNIINKKSKLEPASLTQNVEKVTNTVITNPSNNTKNSQNTSSNNIIIYTNNQQIEFNLKHYLQNKLSKIKTGKQSRANSAIINI